MTNNKPNSTLVHSLVRILWKLWENKHLGSHERIIWQSNFKPIAATYCITFSALRVFILFEHSSSSSAASATSEPLRFGFVCIYFVVDSFHLPPHHYYCCCCCCRSINASWDILNTYRWNSKMERKLRQNIKGNENAATTHKTIWHMKKKNACTRFNIYLCIQYMCTMYTLRMFLYVCACVSIVHRLFINYFQLINNK